MSGNKEHWLIKLQKWLYYNDDIFSNIGIFTLPVIITVASIFGWGNTPLIPWMRNLFIIIWPISVLVMAELLYLMLQFDNDEIKFWDSYITKILSFMYGIWAGSGISSAFMILCLGVYYMIMYLSVVAIIIGWLFIGFAIISSVVFINIQIQKFINKEKEKIKKSNKTKKNTRRKK